MYMYIGFHVQVCVNLKESGRPIHAKRSRDSTQCVCRVTCVVSDL